MEATMAEEEVEETQEQQEEQQVLADIGNDMQSKGILDGEAAEQEAATPAEEEQDSTPNGEEAARQEQTELDPLLVRAGQRYGLSEEDIASLGDKAPDILQKIKGGQDEISRRLGEIGRQASQNGAEESASVNPQPTQPQPAKEPLPSQQGGNQPQVQTQTTQQSLGDPLEAFELDEDVYGDAVPALDTVRERVNSMQEVLQQKMQRMDQLYEVQRQTQERQAIRQADSHLQSLGEAFDQYYGKGDFYKMNPESQAFKNRKALYDKAGQILTGANKQGASMSLEDAVEAAASLLTPDLKQDAVTQETVTRLKKESEQAISTPASRNGGAEPDREPEEEAIDAASKKAKDIGIKRWG